MLGLHIRAPNVTVRSGKLVQTAQAIFLSYLRNWEVVSRFGPESVLGTLMDEYLSEVSELECLDSSFHYESPPIARTAKTTMSPCTVLTYNATS